MDYGTFFFTNIASVTVIAVCISLLAWNNRRVVGLRFFAVAQIVGLSKLILQGLEGKIPLFFASLCASDLYLLSILLQCMGLRWFVVRKSLPRFWPWIAYAIVVVAYGGAFIAGLPYSYNIVNLSFIAISGVSVCLLLKHADTPFFTVARVAAGVAALQGCVALYRAILTTLRYINPQQALHAHTDPCWLYSLVAAAFFASLMAVCELWFLVTELNRELAEQARTDPLTGALNRRAMEEVALRETARSARYATPLSMIVLDIDKFKRLNDTRGHAAGDGALQGLVRCMQSILRKQDQLARTGGEEFAILLPDTTGSEALTIAERIRKVVEELEIPYESEPIKLTVCAGIAQLDPEAGWEAMMRRADAAMYESKQHGRNLVSTLSVFRLKNDWAGIRLGKIESLPAARCRYA